MAEQQNKAEDRPRKLPRVKQNHAVIITSINNATMDHFCKVTINPDRMNPDGTVKYGIKINLREFSKGAQVLGERCNYRLLTPLSSHGYVHYLNKQTEEYLESRLVNGPEKPVIEVFNHTPFFFKKQNFTSLNGKKVFEIFNIEQKDKGFAQEVEPGDLPFLVNWAGGEQVRSMQVNDDSMMGALVEMIGCFDELQPSINGLGLCALTEFGRILLYNIIVDGDREGHLVESDDEDMDIDVINSGYKQMILMLFSKECETGKSFLAETLLRIVHGHKTGLNSTISFESAKDYLKKGELIVIDDYNNDDLGARMLSRCSKAIWGQSTVTIRGKAVVPRANLVICSNEEIQDLKVDGKNKEEIHMKFSVLNLGEDPLSNSTNKAKNLQRILELAKVIRKNIPSFFGFMLQACGMFISVEEFQLYRDITKHERLGNILKNCQNVFTRLGEFCDKNNIDKPKSLRVFDVSSLIEKSAMAIRFKTPDQMAEILITQEVKSVKTEHANVEGIAFCYKNLTKYPWLRETINYEKDNIPAYSKMRSRKMKTEAGEARKVIFLRFDFLQPSTVEKLLAWCDRQERKKDPKDLVTNFIEREIEQMETTRSKRQNLAISFIVLRMCQDQNNNEQRSTKLACRFCKFVGKSTAGLKNHQKRCSQN